MIAYDMLGKWGELGNQFFEIAATEALAKRNDVAAVFPQWKCVKSGRVYSEILLNRLNENLELDNITCAWQEPSHSFHEIPFKDNMVIRGYFQTEKYWSGYEEHIHNIFTPANYIEDYLNANYGDIINSDNTVGVHIRSQTRKEHDDSINHKPPAFEYFRRAFDEFGKDYQYIIFSDNIPLMREWFSSYDFTFIETGNPYDNKGGERAITESDNSEPIYDNVVELFLMSKCKHAITTSSSFGWWGAWLIKNKDKRVVSMHEDMWFGSEMNLDLKDLIPESWIKIKI